MLNTLHEVLIFLEDGGRVALKDFKGWKSRQVRGALGRLEREKWVKKDKKDGQIYYELSARGQREIDDTLARLRERGKKWSGNWYLVMFDIPEKERDLRDKFRRSLANLNLANLQGSVWVSSQDIRKAVKEIAQSVGVSDERLNVFTVHAENDRNVANAWDLAELNKSYRRFIRDSDRALKQKGDLDRFSMKKLIFDYAMIRKQDPGLPSHLMPRDWAEEEAFETYQKLRREIT